MHVYAHPIHGCNTMVLQARLMINFQSHFFYNTFHYSLINLLINTFFYGRKVK